jgi:hypothetical protein
MQKVYNENEKEFMLPNWFKNLFKLQWNPEPDFAVEQNGKPYIVRWWIIPRNRFFNIWLHEIYQSDTDVGLHDHPWNNMTFVLKGGYEEVALTYSKNLISHYADQTSFYDCEQSRFVRKRFNVVFRNAREPHRLVLSTPARTLFFTGPAYREWGFHCKDGWVHFATFKKNRAKASAAVDTNSTTVPNTANSKKSVDFEI